MRKHLVQEADLRAADIERREEDALEADRRRLVFRLHSDPKQTAEHYARVLGMTVERVETILEAMVADGSANSETPQEAG